MRRSTVSGSAVVSRVLFCLQSESTLDSLFANYRDAGADLIRSDAQGRPTVLRIRIPSDLGSGYGDVCRLEHGFHIFGGEASFTHDYEQPVLGQGLIQALLWLGGVGTIRLADRGTEFNMRSPCLIILAQPRGAKAFFSFKAGPRVRMVGLMFSPEFLAHLMRTYDLENNGLFELQSGMPAYIEGRQTPLSGPLIYAAATFLKNPHQGGIPWLHAETKAREILCELLSLSMSKLPRPADAVAAGDDRKLDIARQLLRTQFCPVSRLKQVARMVGMSPTKRVARERLPEPPKGVLPTP